MINDDVRPHHLRDVTAEELDVAVVEVPGVVASAVVVADASVAVVAGAFAVAAEPDVVAASAVAVVAGAFAVAAEPDVAAVVVAGAFVVEVPGAGLPAS